MSSSATATTETVPERPPAWLEPLTRGWVDTLSDHDLGLWTWALWADYQAQRQGGTVNLMTPEQVEALRRATLGLDVDDVAQIVWQRVLQVIAAGDLDRGGGMLRDLVTRWARHLAALDESTTRRRHSRSIARRSKPDALTPLIAEIVQQDPGIRPRALWHRLCANNAKGVTSGVVVRNRDGSASYIPAVGKGSAPISDQMLKARMHAIKKKLL